MKIMRIESHSWSISHPNKFYFWPTLRCILYSNSWLRSFFIFIFYLFHFFFLVLIRLIFYAFNVKSKMRDAYYKHLPTNLCEFMLPIIIPWPCKHKYSNITPETKCRKKNLKTPKIKKESKHVPRRTHRYSQENREQYLLQQTLSWFLSNFRYFFYPIWLLTKIRRLYFQLSQFYWHKSERQNINKLFEFQFKPFCVCVPIVQ